MTHTEHRNANALEQVKVINRGYFDNTDNVDFFGILNIQKLLKCEKIYYSHGGRILNDKYKLWVPHLSYDFNDKTKWHNTFNEDQSIITEELREGCLKNDSLIGEKRVVFMHMLDAEKHKCTKFVGVYELIDQTDTIRHFKRVADKVNISDLK